MMGISADKVSRYESWDRQDDSSDSAADRWGELLDRLATQGAILTVGVAPATSANEASLQSKAGSLDTHYPQISDQMHPRPSD